MQFVHPAFSSVQHPLDMLGEQHIDGAALVHRGETVLGDVAEVLRLFGIANDTLAFELGEDGSQIGVAGVLDGHGWSAQRVC
jgi:hypothetical protein